MTTESPWRDFERIMEDPVAHLRERRERTGKKVIGHLLPDVPEEIIHAAGAIPFAIDGARVVPSQAAAHVPGYVCAHSVGALEMGLTRAGDVLDGMVIPYVCDTTRNIFHVWMHHGHGVMTHLVRFPKRIDFPQSREYLREEFKRLIEAVGEATGATIGTAGLEGSIVLYNRSREMLRGAYRLHTQYPHLWTADRIRVLVGSSQVMEREEHLMWMQKLPWAGSTSESKRARIPLYVRGKVWNPPGITQFLDELGFVVVQDEVTTGYRGIAVDASLDGDPLDCLVARHMALVPYAGYHLNPDKLVGDFLSRVQASGAEGVLFMTPKFCEPAGFDTPDLQKALEDRGIPSLVLETSLPGGTPLQQVRLRLQAFSEMIAGPEGA